MRMPVDRIPRLVHEARDEGRRSRGRPRRKWHDDVSDALQERGLSLTEGKKITTDRKKWRSLTLDTERIKKCRNTENVLNSRKVIEDKHFLKGKKRFWYEKRASSDSWCQKPLNEQRWITRCKVILTLNHHALWKLGLSGHVSITQSNARNGYNRFVTSKQVCHKQDND